MIYSCSNYQNTQKEQTLKVINYVCLVMLFIGVSFAYFLRFVLDVTPDVALAWILGAHIGVGIIWTLGHILNVF
jgi:small-conductance mechanosensitive channel